VLIFLCACNKENEDLKSVSSLQNMEKYSQIDKILISEEISFKEALRQSKNIKDFQEIVSKRNITTRAESLPNIIDITNNSNYSAIEKQIYFGHLDSFAQEVSNAISQIPENEDPENEYLTNIVNNIRNKYIADVDDLDLPLTLKDNLKQQIYFNNGVVGIIINSTEEIYNLASQEANNGDVVQTRGWFKKLWRKIGGALGCTLLTAASISQPVTILSGLGYALSGACWISWLTSTGL